MNQQQRKYFSNKVDERLSEFQTRVNRLCDKKFTDPYRDKGTRFLEYVKGNKATALSLDLLEVALIGEMKKQLETNHYRSDSIPSVRLDKLVRGWESVDSVRCEEYSGLCERVKNIRRRAEKMAELIKDKAMLGNVDSEDLMKSLDGFAISLEGEYNQLDKFKLN
jgi:hypothetical protein